MRILFVGSGELACPALQKMEASRRDDLVGVVSQPDRPKGRRRKLAPCPLKERAEKLGLKVFTPEDINNPDFLNRIQNLEVDVMLVAAYGQFLSRELVDLASHGAINIHPSLLPKYRGAAPIQWALINGDKKTGVTILYVSEEMDAGDIICQTETTIKPAETAAELADRLAEIGGDLARDAIEQIRSGDVTPQPQDEKGVVFAPKLRKGDGRITFQRSAEDIANRIRGLYPWPCCFYETGGGRRLRLLFGLPVDRQGEPGSVVAIDRRGPVVACGEGALLITRIQPPGKKPMSGRDYCNGHQLETGEALH